MYAWHFLAADRKMSYGTRALVEQGKTYRVDGDIQICAHGLHASKRALDALQYAPGPIVCRVEMGGRILEDKNKLVAQERSVIWMADATGVLRDYARWCALSVWHLWDMPDVVRSYLENGSEEIRAAAWDAARDAAWDAAWSAAWDAAWYAARAKQNSKLEDMLYAIGPRDVEEN